MTVVPAKQMTVSTVNGDWRHWVDHGNVQWLETDGLCLARSGLKAPLGENLSS